MKNAIMISDTPLDRDFPKSDCDCSNCQTLCVGSPGWFRPHQVEKAAKYLEMTTEEFFDKHLIVEYWVGSEGNDKHVLAPRRKSQEGQSFARWSDAFQSNSPCSLLGPEGCTLPGDVRPFKCSATFSHDCDKDRFDEQGDLAMRSRIAEEWQKDKAELKQLELV